MLPMVHTLVMYAFLMVQPQSQVVLLVCEMAAGAAHHHLMVILTQPSSQVLLVVSEMVAVVAHHHLMMIW